MPYMQGDGVCFRCLHPTKTHLLHSDMDWGRSIHVPAQSFSEMGRGSTQEPPCRLFDMSIFSALLSQYGIKPVPLHLGHSFANGFFMFES